MTADVEIAPPKPPRGLRQSIRREWFRIVKDMRDQGIDPHRRTRELEMMIRLIAEESDLDYEWEGASLSEKLALGRRMTAICNQKLRILKLIFNSGDST